MKTFEKKVIFITGHSSGIGAAIAEAFADEGAIVTGLSTEQGDVREPEQVKQAIEEAVNKYGSLDVLVTSAGVYSFSQSDITTMDVADFDETMDVNFKGTFLAIKYALPHLEKSQGSIVTISSAIGILPEKESPIYCSSKAAVIMLTKSLALQYAPKKVQINAVCPGPIDTPMLRKAFPTDSDLESYLEINPMKRAGTPEEVARLVLFLADPKSEYITGGVHTIDGGEFIN